MFASNLIPFKIPPFSSLFLLGNVCIAAARALDSSGKGLPLPDCPYSYTDTQRAVPEAVAPCRGWVADSVPGPAASEGK